MKNENAQNRSRFWAFLLFILTNPKILPPKWYVPKRLRNLKTPSILERKFNKENIKYWNLVFAKNLLRKKNNIVIKGRFFKNKTVEIHLQ